MVESIFLGLGFVVWPQHGASSTKAKHDLDVVSPTVDEGHSAFGIADVCGGEGRTQRVTTMVVFSIWGKDEEAGQ